MEDLFDGLEADLKDLNPKVQKEALKLAKELMAKEGYDRATAIKKAIVQAEERFLDLEG